MSNTNRPVHEALAARGVDVERAYDYSLGPMTLLHVLQDLVAGGHAEWARSLRVAEGYNAGDSRVTLEDVGLEAILLRCELRHEPGNADGVPCAVCGSYYPCSH